MSADNDSDSFALDSSADRPRMDEATFVRLRDLISRASGIFFEADARGSLERRLRPRVEALHLADFEHYFLHLQSDRDGGEELQRALDAVAVHETYFFREERALRAFAEEMLPQIAARNASTRTLRVWSAGCSTGEEPYTLAMLVRESGLFDDWNVELSASDLSRRDIEEARAGVYRERSFRSIDEARRARYFNASDDGSSLVSDDLRDTVNFHCFNLVASPRSQTFSGLDVIFCRNVLLYFGHDARRHAVEGFHRQLKPGGYLVLGAAESLFTLDAPFRLVHLRHDLVYQKA